MNIDIYRPPPVKTINRFAASETLKAGDREASLADSRSFSDEDGDKNQEEKPQDLDEQIRSMEKKLVALNIKLTASGLNFRYTYSISNKSITITLRNSLTGEAIREISDKELDKVEIRLAEMSGLLIDYNL